MHVQSSCFAHKTDCFLTLLSSSSLKVPNDDGDDYDNDDNDDDDYDDDTDMMIMVMTVIKHSVFHCRLF